MRFVMGLIVLATLGVAAPAQAEQRVARAAPGVFVTLAGTAIDDTERAGHVDAIRRTLRASALFADKHADVTVTRLSVTRTPTAVEIQVELCLVLSNPNNEIVSIANQTAKMVLPTSQAHPSKLPALRREVIDHAVVDLLRKLRRATSRTV